MSDMKAVALNLLCLVLGFAALFAMTSDSPFVDALAGSVFLLALTAVMLYGLPGAGDGRRIY